MNVLIADDEAPARERLSTLLSAESDLQIVAQCSNGPEALQTAIALRPDLIFLDVEMPGMDGIRVLESLNEVWTPRVVFTTAHAEPAVAAFELEAIDYLLKPYSRTRLASALSRARRQSTSLSAAPWSPAEDHPPGTDRLLVKSGKRYVVVESAHILSIQAAANYVIIQTKSARHIMRCTLREISEKLCPRRFFRTSRSSIANLHEVRELKSTASGGHLVLLSDGSDLPLTCALRDIETRLRNLT